MKVRRIQNQTPQSSPPSSMADGGTAGDERFVWEVLVPRLLHPGKLAIIQTLLREGRPLPLSELARAVDVSVDHARYHCKAMQSAGVLEIVGVTARADGEGDEPSYFFSNPPREPSSSHSN